MTKEELRARRAEKAKQEDLDMQHTLIVDAHCSVNRTSLLRIADAFVNMYELPGVTDVQLMQDYYKINIVTSDERKLAKMFAAAMMSLRLSKVPNTMLLVTYRKDISSWVRTHTGKGSIVYVYDLYTNTFYNTEEYKVYAKELKLDAIMQASYTGDREILERFAEIYAEPYGWSFSTKIRNTAPTPDYLDFFRTFEITPFAGQLYYKIGDEVYDKDILDARTTVTPGRKKRLEASAGVPMEELQAFADYLIMIFDPLSTANSILPEERENFILFSNEMEHSYNSLKYLCLQEDWTLCPDCDRPVRNYGSDPEAGYCPICGAKIPDFELQDRTSINPNFQHKRQSKGRVVK